MAKDSTQTLVTLGILGAAAYFAWQWWQTNCVAGATGFPCSMLPASTAAAATTTSTTTPTATTTTASTPAPATPTYSGPSLSVMFSALQSAVAAAYGSDPALTCSPGMGIVDRSPIIIGKQIGPVLGTGMPAGPASNISSVTPVSATSGATRPSRCANPYALYDVFNWYLVNRANVGISSAPAPPDNTTVLSLSDYWAWAAPLLQAQIPGLSGYGAMYAGLGALAARMRGW